MISIIEDTIFSSYYVRFNKLLLLNMSGIDQQATRAAIFNNMSTPRILTPEELAKAITERLEWTIRNGEIAAKFEFKDFKSAMAFITIVALEAEKHNHHPTWTNSWNLVELSFCTHDAGHTITELDFLLADLISQAATQIGGRSVG